MQLYGRVGAKSELKIAPAAQKRNPARDYLPLASAMDDLQRPDERLETIETGSTQAVDQA